MYEERLLKTSEVCEMLSCDRRMLYTLRDLGVLVSIKLGKSDAYRYSALIDFLDYNMGKDFHGIDRMSPTGAQKKYGHFA